jgi:demethylmenaquinone methyltransferase/2-methoxy-6-polyprenyl-1,4-benzoquinol methylase
MTDKDNTKTNSINNRDFGFRKVTSQEKRSLVDGVFSDVASKYDLMNDIMSFGLHRLWKSEFCSHVPDLNSKILDVAGGSGDIAFKLKEISLKQGQNLDLVITDINTEMLKVCSNRAIDKNYLSGINIVAADAENLPFKDNSFDYYTISFGIRNMVSIDKALMEARRVLKPMGKFLCLEFSKVDNEILDKLYEFYSFHIIPKIGNILTGNESAYKYVSESIKLFPTQDEFKSKIFDAGFTDVGYKNLTFGVATIHWGYK